MQNLGNVTIQIEAPSYWLQSNQFQEPSSRFNLRKTILNTPKKITQTIAKPVRLVKNAIQRVNEILLQEAQLIHSHWLGVEKSVENARVQSESITRNLCASPPCRLCNMNDAYKKEWATFSSSAGSGGLIGLFGGTKTETVKIRVNYFKCDIFRRTTKKCICVWKCWCDTIRVEEYFDKACMLRVDAALKEASQLEELAYWKEEVRKRKILKSD